MNNRSWAVLALCACLAFADGSRWRGTVRDRQGAPLPGVQVELKHASDQPLRVTTDSGGAFQFSDLKPGSYLLRIGDGPQTPIEVGPIERTDNIRLGIDGGAAVEPAPSNEATGGEQLSSEQVSALPLNKRDFSQLLLLATGTQTDTNGAANFTQQFTVNGQRGTATVFAMDGIDTTDPEMGGATFSNFNVDAIQEINSNSGVMLAEIGHGAAGFTQVITKSGTNDLHGSVFEFVRNAVFDARNFFDRRSAAQPGRLPPFNRNEFGFTNGGPLVIPRVYDGRNRTFYFGQYQGFRQVLGTTQVLPVPTLDERAGLNSTAFPGDVLTVPVNPEVAGILARYPLPNDGQGPYGARTYATSSKVRTVTDQFSIRIDHKVSDKGRLFGRFNFNNVDGPLTNPSQTAIDPSFAIRFFDHQRNAGISYTYTPTANLISESAIGYVRSTPNFPTINRVEPGINFADGLYESFNAPAGQIIAAYGNLYQVRQVFTWNRKSHTWKAGAEVRVNRDTTLFGIGPNGAYTFGGGTAYSPVEIRSRSGLHDIHVGDPLPDALSGFLSGTPFSYTVNAAPPIFAQGDRMGDSAVRRQAYNFFVQDTWKISARVSLNYGLRYEYNSPIREAALRSSDTLFEDASGNFVDPRSRNARVRYVVNTEPTYQSDWTGWAPRAALDWRITDKTVFRAGGSITTLLTNLFQSNFVTGGMPYVVAPYMTAEPGAPVPFSSGIIPITLPEIYTPEGNLVYPTGKSTDVAPNTEMDILRFERDLAALSTDKQVRTISAAGMVPNFRNGYIASYTAGLERSIGDVTVNAAYVGTAGIKLARIDYPNGYPAADPSWAPYADSGYGPILLMSNRSHSSYHSLQVSAGKNSLRAGLGFQASYTFSKSIDDTSAVLGGFLAGASGTLLQTSAQDPNDLRKEKAPSTFDVTHAFSMSAIQELPFDKWVGGWKRATGGWQVLGVATLVTGAPFTVYSGIQQTGAGANGADRPDQIAAPELSTSRTVREDYFGRGADNASFFALPIRIAGGTGPNSGRFGTLGRNTFRGPAFHNFDFSVIKNTPIGGGSNPERVVLQFRAEVFNIFNLVNFGLPSNIVLGPGFGVINRTAGPSRQIQFSLKVLY